MPKKKATKRKYTKKKKPATKKAAGKKKKTTEKLAESTPAPAQPERRVKWIVDVVVDDKTYTVSKILVGDVKSDKIEEEELGKVYKNLFQQYGLRPMTFDQFKVLETKRK